MIMKLGSLNKNCVKRPQAEDQQWRHIRLAIKYNHVISETMHRSWKVTMERYKEVMVAFSESVMKECAQRPLAVDWRWRHVRLAIQLRLSRKPCIADKSYYWTLSWILGRLVIFIKNSKYECKELNLLMAWVARIKQQIYLIFRAFTVFVPISKICPRLFIGLQFGFEVALLLRPIKKIMILIDWIPASLRL